ncbi:MAG: peptidylprolyl isomerase [Deferrisomatales bacterium]|nr:peptidylprolyl isomerase [Deferrisomatales bacterium]
MLKTLLLVVALGLAVPAAAAGNPKVALETSKGRIVLELQPDKAPVTVENFLRYVDDGAYDGTIFHRVIKGFMLQGGGFTAEMKQTPTRPSIKNEAGNGLANKRGTVAMARTNVVDSATTQFFINSVDNAFLDHRDESAKGFGYAVFGQVVEGMDVVDAISSVKTGMSRGFRDVPVEPVVIVKAVRLP